MYTRKQRRESLRAVILGVAVAGAAACSSSNNNNNPDGSTSNTDAGSSPLACSSNAGQPAPSTPNMSGMLNAVGSYDAGFTSTSPNTPGSIEVTISGETLGENGLPFVPVNNGDPQFVDGWNVKFDKYIVVIGNLRLSPQALFCAPTDLSPLITPPVATKAGPYVVDVHQLDVNAPGDFVGADGMEPAGAVFTWNAQDNGQPFDTGTLYAFTYDTVVAQYPATQVNLTADDIDIYNNIMVPNGFDKYIEAEATYVGYGATAGAATASQPYPDPAIQAEFAKLPQYLHFKLGWHDATSSVNCINTANGNFDGDNAANRGVQPNTSEAVIAQVTIHTDHVFWDKLKQEGTPLRMDPIAAWLPQPDGGTEPFDLGTLANIPIAATFQDCTPLPDRAPYQDVPGGYTSDQSGDQVVLNLNGVTATNIKGLTDFMAFSAQSQTHLNANGLCYIIGQNAVDPFFVPDVAPEDGGTLNPGCMAPADAGTPDAG